MLQKNNLVILTLLLAAVGTVHLNLRIGAHGDQHVNNRWLQPLDVDEQFEHPVASDTWDFDYTGIETVLWQSKTGMHGELIINAETENILRRAIIQLPKEMAPQQIQRFDFLVRKGLPLNDGNRLSHLLVKYYYFHKERQTNILEPDNLTHALQIQERYFGVELAKKLFFKKNGVRNYLNERRLISLDTHLTSDQQSQRLAELQQKYINTRLTL